jgi:hypothetical protein
MFLLSFQLMTARQLTFCGQPVPIQDQNVQHKFYTIIRTQIPVANLQSIRHNFSKYSGFIRKHLAANNLPMDLQYLPIVESNFRNSPKSKAGAAGLWQIMPKTATSKGLSLYPEDQRLNPNYSTPAACKVLYEYYKIIQRENGGKGDWALTCAAYNFGPGNVIKMMRAQKGNYFTMNMNQETAKYVYKILAIKELFEHPEDYSGKQYFGTNVFATPPPSKPAQGKQKVYTIENEKGEQIEVQPMQELEDKDGFNLSYDETIYPVEDIEISLNKGGKKDTTNTRKIDEEETELWEEGTRIQLMNLSADIADGDLVQVKFLDDFNCTSMKKKKNETVKLEVRIDKEKMHLSICKNHLYFLKQKGVPLSRLGQQQELRAILIYE